jgi:hypothetical protein
MKQAMADCLAEVKMRQEIYPLEMKAGSNSGLLFAANVSNGTSGVANSPAWAVRSRTIPPTGAASFMRSSCGVKPF